MGSTLALLGAQEGIVVLLVILVLFGGQKIPELMRGVGQGIGELKRGMDLVYLTLGGTASTERRHPRSGASR